REAFRLVEAPLAHVPAVRPAADAEPLRIGNATAHQIVHAGHHILKIAAAPISAVCGGKLLPVSDRAANVRLHHRIAVRDQELSERVETVAPCARGTAVDQGYQ